MNNVFNRVKEALDQYLASKKASDLIHATSNQFNFEVKGTSSGYKIRRFVPNNTTAIFSAFASFPAMLADSVTQTLQHMGEITLDHIKALSIQYESHAHAPIERVDLSGEFASTQVANAVDFQIACQLDDIARVQDGSFIGPLRSEMADLKTAFDAGKLNTDEFQREALYLRGVVFSKKDNEYAVSKTTINQLRSAFDGGYGSSPVIIFRDSAQQIYFSPAHQQIGAPAPVYA